jgi:rRNA maturation endonuclease Nob1
MADIRDIKHCDKCRMAFAGNLDSCPSCGESVPDTIETVSVLTCSHE